MRQPSLLHQRLYHKLQHPSHLVVPAPSTSAQSWVRMPDWKRGPSTKATSPVSLLLPALPSGSYPLSLHHLDSLIPTKMAKSSTVEHPDVEAQPQHTQPRISSSTATMRFLWLCLHLRSNLPSSMHPLSSGTRRSPRPGNRHRML